VTYKKKSTFQQRHQHQKKNEYNIQTTRKTKNSPKLHSSIDRQRSRVTLLNEQYETKSTTDTSTTRSTRENKNKAMQSIQIIPFQQQGQQQNTRIRIHATSTERATSNPSYPVLLKRCRSDCIHETTPATESPHEHQPMCQ
jgi:hypothetical protein